MLSKAISQYIESLKLPPSPDYEIEDVKTAIKDLTKKKVIQVRKTDGCPTLVPFFWYMGKLYFQGQTIKSSGEGFYKTTAQIRCVGELFERIPMSLKEMPCQSLRDGQLVKAKKSIKNSNGLSFALNIRDGIFNSYRELVERQVVLDYWLNKKKCLEIKGFGKWSFLNKLSGIKNDLRAKFYYLANDYGLFVICGHISCQHGPPYNIFGYGCHEDINKAIEKAFLEAWRFYWEFGKLEENQGLSLGPVKNFVDHFNFYAFKQDGPPCYFPEKKTSVERIKKTIRTYKNFKFDDITIFELKEHNLPGYCIKVIRDDFWDFRPGGLKQDIRERNRGEVHPVA